MKKLALLLLLSVSIFSIYAGKPAKTKGKSEAKAAHRIIFQLTTNDTLAHKALMKQLNNITTVEPSTQIEVVCHTGLDMLVQSKQRCTTRLLR